LARIFQPRIDKKISKVPSIKVIIICSENRHNCAYGRTHSKGVDCAKTLDKSLLNKITMIGWDKMKARKIYLKLVKYRYSQRRLRGIISS